MLSTVLDALKELRSPFAFYETDLHRLVAKRLDEAGLAYVHEARLGAGCRIDYLVEGVGVEIKKGKPDAARLKKQILRYAAFDSVSAIIVLSQRSVALPRTALGKPVCVLALDRLWGVALP